MCAVAGAFNVPDAFQCITSMMDGMPHRGENGAGISLGGKDDILWERSEFTLPYLLHKVASADVLDYSCGIGHLRYGTTGDRRSVNDTQPFKAKMSCGEVYMSHNGDSPFVEEDRRNLIGKGQVFSTSSDSELVFQYMAGAGSSDLLTCLKKGLSTYRGTFAIAMLVKGTDGSYKLIATRDRYGNRPLKLGRLGLGYVVASEDVAFEKVDAEYIRDILPGEILIIYNEGLKTEWVHGENDFGPLYQCIYEAVYFSHPTTEVFGIPVGQFREVLGCSLAKRCGELVRENDIVTYVPDSARFYAEGFCDTISHPLVSLILRTHSTRSFIQENNKVREDTLRRKFSFMHHRIKEILRRNPFTHFWVIDDSIVRGNVSRKIIRALKRIAKRYLAEMGFDHEPWIGWLSAAPAILGECGKGIDMPGKEGILIAPQFLVSPQVPDEGRIAKELEASHISYLPLQDLYDAVRLLGKNPRDYCFGCFENRDPIWNKW